MRIILVTGKGGVGKTTISAATALAAADRGMRTLVTSTDPAHSLADALGVELADQPLPVVPGLMGQQLDTHDALERHWGTIQEELKRVFDWGGVGGIEAEEFLVFPGMEELFALLEVNQHARSGDYDLIVVDCAPTAETLRLLSLPEVLSWYFEKVMPTQRRLMKAVRPVLSRVSALPVPGDEVFGSAITVFSRVEEVKELLGDPEVTTARLVMNPESMVIDEARRTYTYLGLFGYGVDGVVVNRVLPEEADGAYFARWREIQARHLERVDANFAEVPRLRVRLFDDEMVGVDKLRLLADELYGDRHPIEGFEAASPFEVSEDAGRVTLHLSVPFVEGGELSVKRHGRELGIGIGPYRRAFVIPDTLTRRQIESTRLHEGTLSVVFGLAS